MWIITENDDYVNCSNIYAISIEKYDTCWGAFAHSTNNKVVELGKYSTKAIAEHAMEIFIDCVGLKYAGYVMPTEEDVLRDIDKKREQAKMYETSHESKPLQWDDIELMDMKG